MSDYTPALGDKICDGIIIGKSLVKVCKELQINYRYVFDWLKEYPDFLDNYTRARDAQADYYADAVIEIADTEEHSDKARVRIDARKWVAGKMKPKKYGDKQLGSADDPIHTIGVLEWKSDA
jgi:hypothetical protein